MSHIRGRCRVTVEFPCCEYRGADLFPCPEAYGRSAEGQWRGVQGLPSGVPVCLDIATATGTWAPTLGRSTRCCLLLFLTIILCLLFCPPFHCLYTLFSVLYSSQITSPDHLYPLVLGSPDEDGAGQLETSACS